MKSCKRERVYLPNPVVGGSDRYDILTAMAAISARCIFRVNGCCQDGCPGSVWCEYALLPKVRDITELKNDYGPRMVPVSESFMPIEHADNWTNGEILSIVFQGLFLFICIALLIWSAWAWGG